METENWEGIRVETVSLIHVQFCRGDGTHEDPLRTVDQYWAQRGTLVAEIDSLLVSRREQEDRDRQASRMMSEFEGDKR